MSLVDRRTFLSRLSRLGLGAGASLLAPMLSGPLAEAAGLMPTARRFVVFVYGNGLEEARYKLKATSETDFDLGPIWKPFEPFRSRLLFLHPFFNPHNRDLHGNGWATLAVQPSPSTGCQSEGDCFNKRYGRPSGLSFDRYLAGQIGAGTPFSSTSLCITHREDAQMGKASHVSSDGPDRPFPAEPSPVTAYGKLFGRFMGGSAEERARLLANRKSVLDFIKGDVRKAEGALAAPEREKLQQYLGALEALETQVARLAAADLACAAGAAPEPRLHALQTENGPLQPEVVKAQVDLTFNALACGLTRVGAISIYGGGAPEVSYDFLGKRYWHHTIAHEGDGAKLAQIDNFVCSQVAALAARLAATPEGDGSMLDNTIIMLLNSGGGVHHFGHDKHAVILLGNAGKALRTGRQITLPPKRHCISDLFVSVAQALGVNTTTFGDPKVCKGPVPGLT